MSFGLFYPIVTASLDAFGKDSRSASDLKDQNATKASKLEFIDIL